MTAPLHRRMPVRLGQADELDCQRIIMGDLEFAAFQRPVAAIDYEQHHDRT